MEVEELPSSWPPYIASAFTYSICARTSSCAICKIPLSRLLSLPNVGGLLLCSRSELAVILTLILVAEPADQRQPAFEARALHADHYLGILVMLGGTLVLL